MSVTSIAFSAYPAKNVPKLLAFYRDVLGLRVGRAHPSEEEAELVEFELGGDHWFSLLPESFVGRAAGSGSGVVFEVDDIDGILGKVRQSVNTADDEPNDYPHCRMASFEDPEGNQVGLHQALAPAS